MKYEEFEQMLLHDLYRDFFQGREDVTVELESPQQEAGMGQRLCVTINVTKQEGVMMRYPMDALYQMAGRYNNKVALEVIGSKIMQDYNKMAGPLKQIAGMKNYEDAKSYLGIRLLGIEKSGKKLENAIYSRLPDAPDLALVPHLKFGDTVARITPQQVQRWGVPIGQIMEDAMKGERKRHPYSIEPLKDVIEEIAGMSIEEDGGLVLVSNQEKEYGAVALLYPEVLEQLGKQYGDFTILPSSIHETLILPDQKREGITTSDRLEEMVRDINETQVSPEDRLSDCVYHYDTRTKKLELMKAYEARCLEQTPPAMEESLRDYPGETLGTDATEEDSPALGPRL